ncbi:glycoside hydrolase family 51 protein [Hypholoma sublateritium FD-334 SS-4]|uniref:non-reducing end alpha-L-arabinofuranosidase n=1 Tax=Hypholoma sublateritium (strain FD-334 SS-4) TaxID=945553 RepID=A0A0D2PF30_HYPSF|nr:glycoside hydrolase family 51 protein [Hypholoma sublateritium FD-334 SS-4]
MWSLHCIGLVSLALARVAAAVTVTVSATASHPIPSTLWGQMFEVRYFAIGDGGLYAELLQNRAFQQVTPGTSAALTAWAAINGAGISVVQESVPVSTALPNALHVTIPTGKTGAVGFSNSGYTGIKVASGSTYAASFYYRFPTSSSFSGSVTIGLQSSTGQVLGSATATLSGSQTTWKQVSVTINPTTSASALTNLFTVTVDGAAASGQTINFAMFSLFPPTFKNRPNGMRVDIATALQEMGPSFFRLPGGNNLEGQTTATRWQWNATALRRTIGRTGDWGYVNTDGLGLFEYLTWCEDLGMQPIMAVWSGYSLGGTSVASTGLQPYIQQAIDQINFVVGDPSASAAAALRSSLGHPAPFTLNYVEIGNEDFFASSTYTYRWTAFANALKAAFPAIQFIATSDVGSPVLSPVPTEYDVHVYQTPTWFAQNSFYYDSFARGGTKYFEGEYAAISTNSSNLFGTPSQGRLTYPTMQSAAGEAAFMTGLERNSDIVFAASYAPLLGHITANQWTPNLLAFDAGSVYRSTSFYVQKLFSLNRGDSYLPSTLPSQTGTLFWSVVRQTSTNQIIIKVSNTAASAAPLTFVLPFSISSSGTLQLLTGTATASNTPTNPTLFAPVSSTISTGSTFNYNAPAVSVSVITLTIASGTASTTTPTTTIGTASGAMQSHFGQCGG